MNDKLDELTNNMEWATRPLRRRRFAVGFAGLGLAVATQLMFGLVTLRTALGQTYTITDLGTLGGREAVAYGINRTGHVVGKADTAKGITSCDPYYGCHTNFVYHAFLWTPTTPNGTSGVMQDIGPSGANSYGEARGVNDSGDVIGTFLWESGRIVNNAPGGIAINDAGQVLVGASIWQNGVSYPLGSLFGSNGFSAGYAINNFGQVVGQSLTNGFNQSSHAFLFTPTVPNGTNGSMVDLGTLGLYDINEEAYAAGINAQGQ